LISFYYFYFPKIGIYNIIFIIIFFFCPNFYFLINEINWGLGIGDWGLGIGDWAQSPIPNPHILYLINKSLLFK